MIDPLFLGIDLGSTQVKAGVYDAQGNTHGLALCQLGTSDAWWESARDAIRGCLEGTDPARLSGLCVGGQGPTLMAVDATGRLVRPAITYDDFRAAPEAASISDTLGRPVSVRSSYLPRVLWMRNREPETRATVRWFLQAWDHLVYQLTEVAAATSPMGIYAPWQEPDIAALGLDPERFPPLLRTGEVVGVVTTAASAQTGLPEGTPVIAGGNDFLLGTMGVGGACKGIAQSQGGASSAFTLCWDSPLDGGMIAWCIPSPIEPSLFNAGGAITTGGAALDWLLRSLLGSAMGYDVALAEAARVPPASSGLLFFPYLAGEPLTFGPAVRGAFLGLSLEHGTAHLVRSVLEGVALAGRGIMESLVEAGGCVDQVLTYGGQARSALWNQIKANVWNRTVTTPKMVHVGCLGAAAIAAVGVGAHPSLQVASSRMAQAGQRYEPDPTQVSAYDEAYRLFATVFPQTGDLLAELCLPDEDPLT
jgi:sugar (pentulose or hexulose) kinase